MDRQMERNGRNAREKRQVKFLLIVAAVVLVCGLFAHITVRAQVSGIAKEIAAVQTEIRAMSAEADNMISCINQHHDVVEIGKRALAMGMTQPQEGQLRRVALPVAEASTQTVANIDGEEING